jgi:hypothetical protein
MKTPSGTEVRTRYGIPADPPAAVQKAWEAFEKVAEAYARKQGEIYDAREAIKAAKAADAQAAVDAALKGKPLPDDLNGLEREARAQLKLLEGTLRPLAAACDVRGNELAAAIGKHREAWAAEQEALDAEAVERYVAAIEEARAALVQITLHRGGAEWLRKFEAGKATAGLVQPFAGVGRTVFVANTDRPVSELLDAAAEAGKPWRKLEPRPDAELRTVRLTPKDEA